MSKLVNIPCDLPDNIVDQINKLIESAKPKPKTLFELKFKKGCCFELGPEAEPYNGWWYVKSDFTIFGFGTDSISLSNGQYMSMIDSWIPVSYIKDGCKVINK